MRIPRSFAAALIALAQACAPDDHFVQQTYLKASNPGEQDVFGRAIALSADGTTLAVGAFRESGSGTGIDPQDNDSAIRAGAVYVFVREHATWSEPVYVKAPNTGAGDWFGKSVALSADGNTLAVGADGEDGPSTGIDGPQGDSAAPTDSGAVYVFSRAAGMWGPPTYVKAPTVAEFSGFGGSVALSPDGLVLAVGAPSARCTSGGTGAVYVYVREAARWSYAQCLSTPDEGVIGPPRTSVALSRGGSILVVGAPMAGAAYVFARAGRTWSLQTPLASADPDHRGEFGDRVAVSDDGALLAIGAPREPGAAPPGGTAPDGAVYVFARGTTWAVRDHVTAASVDAADSFGRSVALSADGATLAVGTPAEDVRLDEPPPPDTCAPELGGTVHVLERVDATWLPRARIKATNTCLNDHFGIDVGLSRDGALLAAGADGESSSASGVNQDDGSNGATNAGAAYVMEL